VRAPRSVDAVDQVDIVDEVDAAGAVGAVGAAASGCGQWARTGGSAATGLASAAGYQASLIQCSAAASQSGLMVTPQPGPLGMLTEPSFTLRAGS